MIFPMSRRPARLFMQSASTTTREQTGVVYVAPARPIPVEPGYERIIAAHRAFHQPALHPTRMRPSYAEAGFRRIDTGSWGEACFGRVGQSAAIALFLIPLLPSLRAYVPSYLCAFFFPRCHDAIFMDTVPS